MSLRPAWVACGIPREESEPSLRGLAGSSKQDGGCRLRNGAIHSAELWRAVP